MPLDTCFSLTMEREKRDLKRKCQTSAKWITKYKWLHTEMYVNGNVRFHEGKLLKLDY